MGDARGVLNNDCAATEARSPLAHPLAQTDKYEPTNEADRLRRRLNTYSQWTSKKSSLQLATAGFIYTGITDKVECQSCGIRLYNWQEDEDPLQAHKKYAPACEFMLANFPNVKAPPKHKKILTVDPGENTSEKSLRKTVTTRARTLLPLLDHTHKSGVKLEHRVVLKRGQQAEFEMRGDDNQPGCVVIVARDEEE